MFFLNIEHVLADVLVELGGLLHTLTCSLEISRGKATFLLSRLQ